MTRRHWHDLAFTVAVLAVLCALVSDRGWAELVFGVLGFGAIGAQWAMATVHDDETGVTTSDTNGRATTMSTTEEPTEPTEPEPTPDPTAPEEPEPEEPEETS